MDIKKILAKGTVLLFDGAMGSMLQEKGLQDGELPEAYNIEKPKLIEEVHKAYIQAGAQVITTNTFQANELKLKDCPYSVEEIIEAGVKIAKTAGASYIALDIGPLGQMMTPLGNVSFDRAYEIFQRQVKAGVKAGADCILIETNSDLYESKAAILAAKENSDLPIFCTMSFQEDGRTYLGTGALTAIQTLQGLGIDALGMNCSLGPEEMMKILPDFLDYCRLPVMVQSNSGLPELVEDQTIFPVEVQEFAGYAKEMVQRGVSIIGGCCGTTPDYIKRIKEEIAKVQVPKRNIKKLTSVSSATQTKILNNKTIIIGERINPTGKERMKEALYSNQYDYILTQAIEQVNSGADILDVNVGLPGIEEDIILSKVVEEIQGVVDVPLQIDSGDPKAIERALRYYNGKGIINSINGKSEIMAAVFPIAKKYGAALIALTLDDKGIPQTAEERLEIAKNIIEEAKKYGIPKEDIIVDPLVMTASAQQSMTQETLKAVALIKEQLGLCTTLGISNVSFGLPNRTLLNRTFLSAALSMGLSTPILDPLSEEMMKTVHAFKVLNGEDKESEKYISYFQHKDIDKKPQIVHSHRIEDNIMNGLKAEVAEQVKELLETQDPQDIIQEYFITTLDRVGANYEEGKLFLPQLLRSAEAVKAGLEVIKNQAYTMSQSKESILEEKKVLVATVKGDIHDIGKNIAKMLLENYGFSVIDMGKDVPPQHILEKVQEEEIGLVGLSALMTTTVKNMEETIELLRDQAPSCKIMVGGAVLTLDYAEKIGADFYAKDGQAGISFAKEVLK